MDQLRKAIINNLTTGIQLLADRSAQIESKIDFSGLEYVANYLNILKQITDNKNI